MKKRMIAWLLCACMTFTAAPEMLLADVAGNAQQTQEENSFKEKGTVETQTVEQDDEKSAVTEKKETDQADEEDHNAGRLAEEESGAAGTEIGHGRDRRARDDDRHGRDRRARNEGCYRRNRGD